MKIFNNRFINFMMLGILVAGITSCNKESELTDSNEANISRNEIKFGALSETAFNTPSLTRADATATPVTDINKFFEDKLICMYVDKVTDEGTVPYYDRKYLTVENNQLVMPEKLYYPEDGSPVNIYVVAATPYSSASKEGPSAKPTGFYQYYTGWQTNSNSDFLYAKIENATNSESPLALQFRHLGTKISIAVTSQDNSKLTKLQVLNTLCQSIYNMDDGSFKENTEAMNATIEASYSDAKNDNFDGTINYASVYIAPEQKIEDQNTGGQNTGDQNTEEEKPSIKFTFNGKEYIYIMPEGLTFEPGTEYKFHINLKPVSRGTSDIEVVCVNEE